MNVALINNSSTASNLLKSGYRLARNLKKDFGIIAFVENKVEKKNQIENIEKYLSLNDFEDVQVLVRQNSVSNLAVECEILEASLLMIQWDDSMNKQLKKYLKYCRDLRIPYLFFKNDFSEMNFQKVLVTVGFLIEDYEKTQFASAFGRFCNSQILVLQANDYGSKAGRTVNKMIQIFNKFNLNYSVEKAKSDSFKLDKEAIQKADSNGFDVVLISASRDYGLDDIIFGPKEYHLVKKSRVPLLIINPRGDLYTLCD